ncbi:MAG: TlpA family protein disulfide reductase [Krumholzibacteria bacterium]|nr:TlpA family protein disulfide reductase [Candidatus Krumholzibacteria bacterium]
MTPRRIFALPLLLLSLSNCAGTPAPRGDDPAEVARTSLTVVGDEAPLFTAPLLDGGTFDLAAQRGKVVLVNFFATWCPPCIAEMPHLQRDVWERFGGEGFAMVSVAREEGADVVAPFVRKHGAGWPCALDTDRSVFARYAEAFIPRSYVLDRNGRIAFQAQGYEEAEFARMVEVIADLLAQPAP